MSDDQPDPEVLECAWCHRPFLRPNPGGRRPDYCRRSHRQRAEEGRQKQRAVTAAEIRLLAGPASISSRDESKVGKARGRGAAAAAVPPADEPTTLF